MKKIIKPLTQEEAECYSDFSGERFHLDIPEATIKISFDYGSQFDDSEIEFHLSDEEVKDVLNFIKTKMSDKTKQHLREKYIKDVIDCKSKIANKDWNAWEQYSSNVALWKYFLNQDDEVIKSLLTSV